MKPYEIVKKTDTTIMGISCKTSNNPEAGPKDIMKLWERFYKEDILHKIPHLASKEVFALYCNYEGDHTKPYTLIIGCPVSFIEDIPFGMSIKHIPGGTYALFKAIGKHPQALIETWGEIWGSDLTRTYTGDFEVYGPKFVCKPQEVEVFVAIKP